MTTLALCPGEKLLAWLNPVESWCDELQRRRTSKNDAASSCLHQGTGSNDRSGGWPSKGWRSGAGGDPDRRY
jgi:hypothetical protein